MLEAAAPTLKTLRQPVEDRLLDVERRLVGLVEADFGAVNEVSEYVLSARGKLIRPMLLLLSNEIGGSPSDEAVTLAAIVELMHIATLVHDDAVDHSPERRGRPTVNSRWSHQVAVIMGDYLYSRALVEMARIGPPATISLLAETSNRMSIGEMRQLSMHDALDTSEEDYYRLCDCKTASLMAAACELGAMFGKPEFRVPVRGFGRNLGMTFQITDDLLDYTSEGSVTGKPSGLDLREHKVTLPLIAALPRMDSRGKARVEELFADSRPSTERVNGVMALVEEAGGLDYAAGRARKYAEAARAFLGDLPDEPPVRALNQAVDYIVERRK